MKQTECILYVSTLCSKKVFKSIFENAVIKPRQAEQKFHRLLAEGFIQQNCADFETLSLIPINFGIHKQLIWRNVSETEGGIKFNYLPFVNIYLLKNIFIIIFSFVKVFLWSWRKRRQRKLVVCDALKLSASGTSLILCKILRIKVLAIITDLPRFLSLDFKKKRSLTLLGFEKVFSFYISFFDGYILLTEQMEREVNPKKKPSIIMEGLVDNKMSNSVNKLQRKEKERVLIYAGGIHEKYGVKKLIEAFLKLKGEDLRLHIYGPGDLEVQMPYFMKLDPRIEYKGIVPNYEIVGKQRGATLLINPRPSHEEFAKYSFPSKNMECMVSGTPLVTTPLPGMPKDHYGYVYIFNDESVEGIYFTLKDLLEKPLEELHCFGENAKKFVLSFKNNLVQARRILNMFT